MAYKSRNHPTAATALAALILAIGGSASCAPTRDGAEVEERSAVSVERHEAALQEIARLRERVFDLEVGGKDVVTEGEEPGADVEASLNLAELQLEACREETARVELEAQRNRQGLQRCVEELNRVSGAGSRFQLPPTPPATRRSRPVRTLAAPRVQIAGEQAIVSARLWNPAEDDQQVTIEVTLLVDGEVEDTRTQQILVPAGGDHALAVSFPWRGETGTLSGRVRVLD